MSEVFVPAMMDDLNPGDSDESGTTSIVLILGNYIYIATDSRLTSMDMVTITKEQKKKIHRFANNLYGSFFGPTKHRLQMKKDLQDYVSSSRAANMIPCVEGASKMLYDYLFDERRLMKSSKKIEQFKATCAFVCGFVDGVPSLYKVTLAESKPVNISFSQTRSAYCGHGASLAQKFLEDNENVLKAELEEKTGDFFYFSNLLMARAIVAAAICDPFTGGDIVVKRISSWGECYAYDYNAAQIYLESFKILEPHKGSVLLTLLPLGSTPGAKNVLGSYFGEFGDVKFSHRIGEFCGFYLHRVMIVVKGEFDGGVGDLSVVYQTILDRSQRKCSFGFPMIESDDFVMSVVYPGESSDVITTMLESNQLGEFNGHFMHRILFAKEMDPSKGDGEAKFANPPEVYRILLERSNGKKCFFGLPLIQDVGFDMSLMMPAERDTLIADLLKSNR